MMDNLSKKRFKIYWVCLFLILGLVYLPGYQIVQEEILEEETYFFSSLTQEVTFLETLIKNALESGDYETVQAIIESWSNNYPDTLSIQLRAKNQFIIGEFDRNITSNNSHIETRIIDYGYTHQATLMVKTNSSWLFEHVGTYYYQLFAIWGVIAFLGIVVLYNHQRHHIERYKLNKLSNKLSGTNRKLIKEQSLQRSLIDSIPDPIYFKNTDGKYMGCNKSFELLTNMKENELIGKKDKDFFDKSNAELNLAQDIDVIKSGMDIRFEEHVTYPNGDQVLLDTLKTAVYDKQQHIVGLIGISRDITQINEYQSQLKELAYHDSLTLLPNRRQLVERMDLAIKNADEYRLNMAVLSLDLDGFKPINDSEGHAVGDQILIEFANRLNQSLRIGDTVARWGGDEFTLIFNDLNSEKESIQLVERLQKLIALPYKVNNKEYKITASIGMTIYPIDNGDVDTLIRHADQAMYDSKLNGKNQYRLFDSAKDKLMLSHQDIRKEIAGAIKQGELELYYQPQINIVQGDFYGVEALIRWHHPENGVQLPISFLPYIEDHELNVKLDWWVIESAIKQLSKWLVKGDIDHISVNVSAITFKMTNFVSKLKKLISIYPEIKPGMVTLELLETTALGNFEVIAEKMTACKEFGITFSLDDFGTGYSSLTYLSRLPADILKIDQSFVQDMLIDEGDKSIVEGIVRLSAAFGRKVIAEGVENNQQGIELVQMGCTYAQGFVIAKPMPVDEIDNWLANYKPNSEWANAA